MGLPMTAFDLEEAPICRLAQAMETGETTSRSITEGYLERIEAMNYRGPALHAVLETNPDALSLAQSLDEERKTGQVRGPLHGVPILVKDNLNTADRMSTT